MIAAPPPTPAGIAFRAMAAADRVQVLAMMRDFYAEDGHNPFVAARAEQALAQILSGDALARLWLIVRDGRVVGYLCVTLGFSLEAGGGDFFLDELYLVPEARGAGIGRAALAFAEAESRALGAARLCLEVERANERARRLYEAHGFAAHDRHLLSKPL